MFPALTPLPNPAMPLHLPPLCPWLLTSCRGSAAHLPWGVNSGLIIQASISRPLASGSSPGSLELRCGDLPSDRFRFWLSRTLNSGRLSTFHIFGKVQGSWPDTQEPPWSHPKLPSPSLTFPKPVPQCGLCLGSCNPPCGRTPPTFPWRVNPQLSFGKFI